MKRRQDGNGRVDSGEEIADRQANLQRPGCLLAVRGAGHAHQTAHRLNQKIVSSARSIRAGLPEARDRAVDHAWIDLADGVVIQLVSLQGAGPEVLDDHVSLSRQSKQKGGSFRLAEVDRQRQLVAVAAQMIGGIGLFRSVLQERGAPAARIVAVRGMLYLVDLRPQIAEQLGAPGSGQHS